MTTTEPKEKKSLFGITFPQLAAGALAAVTTAFATASLGVSGTLIGAGIGSLIATSASAIYSSSLARGQDSVRKALLLQRKEAEALEAEEQELEALELDISREASTERIQAVSDERTEHVSLEVQDALATLLEAHTDDPEDAIEAATDLAELQEELDKPWWKTVHWAQILKATAMSLILAFILITAYERFTGTSLSGSNESTTLGGVVVRPVPVMIPTPPATPSPTETIIIEPEPTETVTIQPTPEPTPTETVTIDPGEPTIPEPVDPPVSPEPTPTPTVPAPTPTDPSLTPTPSPSTPAPSPSPSPSPTPTPDPTPVPEGSLQGPTPSISNGGM